MRVNRYEKIFGARILSLDDGNRPGTFSLRIFG